MKILNILQGKPEWHAHRATHWNASDAPAMLGCSAYENRTQLLQRLATGIAPEVDAGTQRRFDDGHRAEALARPLAEAIIGDDLYPVVGADEALVIHGRALSASFDGLTLDGMTAFEHKSLNDELRAALQRINTTEGADGRQLPEAFRVQMEQQLLVSGAERVLFVASKWDADGQLIEEQHCWYFPDAELRARILSGWRQFAEDLAAFKPSEVIERVAPVGHSPEQLPALRAQASGALVLESNIKEWESAALAYIKSVREHELKTDEDFANADAAAKWCDTSKETLMGVRANLMSATGDVNTAVATLDRIADELDKTRIAFTNAIKARKDARKLEIVAAGTAALKAHIDGLNTRLGTPYMPVIPADFAGVVRGLKSLASMQSKVSDELARCKIEANALADRIDANLKHLREHADGGYQSLFPDTAVIVLKAADDLQALVASRIAAHKDAEEKRLEAERARIRAEEQAKAEKEAREKLAAEQAAQQATQAPAAPQAQPTAAPELRRSVASVPPAPAGNVVPLTLRDRAVVDAALAAIDAEAKPVVRMLTEAEFAECCGGCKVTSAAMTWMRRSVDKAAEVWGLTIGEQG